MNGKDNWRLDLHLMPESGWLNDPNGLCYYQGEYHVFFQYSPDDAYGALKHWGHYKSKDLIHWEFTGIPVRAEEVYEKDGAYSGCAFVEDHVMHLFYTGNTKQDGNYDYVTEGRGANVIHAIYTPEGKVVHKSCILTNADYPEEYTCHVRDPKVWKEENVYYMVLGGRVGNAESNKDGRGQERDTGKVLVYSSRDLLNWEFVQNVESKERFGYMWECPDYYEVNGTRLLSVSPQGLHSEERRYQNVYQSGYYVIEGDITGEYALGEFIEWDMGFDFYAPQSFKDAKGRRIMIGWMGLPDIPYTNPTTERGWQHGLTLPREIVAEDGVVYQRPIEEMTMLRGACSVFQSEEIQAGTSELLIEDINGDCTVTIDGVVLAYSESAKCFKMFFTDDSGYGRDQRYCELNSLESLRIFVDTSAIEVYINGGEKVMTTRYYSNDRKHCIRVEGSGKKRIYDMAHIVSLNM